MAGGPRMPSGVCGALLNLHTAVVLSLSKRIPRGNRLSFFVQRQSVPG
jgi:hypothetical protein